MEEFTILNSMGLNYPQSAIVNEHTTEVQLAFRYTRYHNHFSIWRIVSIVGNDCNFIVTLGTRLKPVLRIFA